MIYRVPTCKNNSRMLQNINLLLPEFFIFNSLNLDKRPKIYLDIIFLFNIKIRGFGIRGHSLGDQNIFDFFQPLGSGCITFNSLIQFQSFVIIYFEAKIKTNTNIRLNFSNLIQVNYMNSGKINSLIPNNNTWPSIIAK